MNVLPWRTSMVLLRYRYGIYALRRSRNALFELYYDIGILGNEGNDSLVALMIWYFAHLLTAWIVTMSSSFCFEATLFGHEMLMVKDTRHILLQTQFLMKSFSWYELRSFSSYWMTTTYSLYTGIRPFHLDLDSPGLMKRMFPGYFYNLYFSVFQKIGCLPGLNG